MKRKKNRAERKDRPNPTFNMAIAENMSGRACDCMQHYDEPGHVVIFEPVRTHITTNGRGVVSALRGGKP
jgi:hypothetical protein